MATVGGSERKRLRRHQILVSNFLSGIGSKLKLSTVINKTVSLGAIQFILK